MTDEKLRKKVRVLPPDIWTSVVTCTGDCGVRGGYYTTGAGCDSSIRITEDDLHAHTGFNALAQSKTYMVFRCPKCDASTNVGPYAVPPDICQRVAARRGLT